jgi:hypothetical protein
MVEEILRLLAEPSLDKLRDLSDAELVKKRDDLFKSADDRVHPVPDRQLLLDRARVYANELARRETVRQGDRMESLTRSMNRLSWDGVGIVGVVLAAMTYFSG